MKKARKYSSAIVSQLLEEITPEEDFEIETKMVQAARIDDLIKAKGWSKGEFAEKANVNASEVSKWLSGTHNLTTKILCKIAFTLGTSIADLHTLPEVEVITTESRWSALSDAITNIPMGYSWNPMAYNISPLDLSTEIVSGNINKNSSDLIGIANLIHSYDCDYVLFRNKESNHLDKKSFYPPIKNFKKALT